MSDSQKSTPVSTKTTNVVNPITEQFAVLLNSLSSFKSQISMLSSQVKALEKIAASVDALAYWFEDIDKTEWSERMQWYLTEYYEKYVAKGE